jgi:ADP-ribose pyrophosphatase YjhB (NUDIX family)
MKDNLKVYQAQINALSCYKCMIEKFNIRIYGLLIRNPGEVLVCDEIRFGKAFTKFPGGGLEYGEGIGDCLKREWMEETQTQIQILSHFYTNDFLQISAFNPREQVISQYYLIQLEEPEHFETKQNRFDFESPVEGAQIFRWMPFEALSPDQLDFPIDKMVGKKLFMEKAEILKTINWSILHDELV